MSKFNKIENNYWRNFATRAVLSLVTIAVIVLLLPRRQSKLFNYEVGQVWRYPALNAQFDFPVFKTDEAIKAERDSVVRQYQPYFNYNDDVEKQQVERFRENFKNGIPGLKGGDWVNYIANRLHALYQRGIIDPTVETQLEHKGESSVRIVVGKEAVSESRDSIMTTINAYERLFMDPRLGPNRTLLQSCNLNEYIEANLVYDKDRNLAEEDDLLNTVTPASGLVQQGERIIDNGSVVDEYKARVLSSYEKALAEHNAGGNEITSTLIGQTIIVSILVILFTLYLVLFRKDYFVKPRNITMLYVMIVIFPMLTSMLMRYNKFSVYLIPFAMAPIFIRVFMDSRTAGVTHVTTILISAIAVKYQYEFIVVQLVGGLIAIYSLRELSKRSQLFLTALLVVIGEAAAYLSLQLIQVDSLTKLDGTMYYHLMISGFLLLFTYPLMLVVEKTFGFVSTVTLFELSNTNNELLRRLSQVAPGTFQHSIMVGNLAAEVANKIGAKGQLVRTGALYHDIGKMTNPAFFTENQASVNPHDKLTEKESAAIIISHVTEGLKMAEKYNLPRVIRDFISTHHGEGLTMYFYVKYKNAHPDEEVDPEPFRYPGPNPFTREQAILMMCDTVEAASRSLNEYTEENISKLVNTLIDNQVAQGYFRDCPITFRDVTVAKQTLIERLKSIYHTRIQYPKLNTKE
ncbi:MAG: HDIG domain-containing protein [Prevotella sp.]|nr:HDIG domain-containing protein [Prevotella sp.]